ncbi:DUF3048 domain-containing protein [Nocardioides alkalitolerans]|uniref:DUF3048 domain-containing protein n=1 Tax=Nocardioides alkalitolerans TaxID=281714 RepID=UPI000A01A93D|nr:DUF3048 domain-containing protein [Nocardioides alkalitolerans]
MTPRTRGVVALAAVGVLLAGCSQGDPEAMGPDGPAETPGASGAPTDAGPTVWPYTGLPATDGDATRPLLVVKIDNTRSSSPQVGLSHADLVVEQLVEGGEARLAVFFQTDVPDEVGPVRSMRATDIGIVPADHATIVTSGAAARTLRRIDEAGIDYVEEGAPGFYRAAGRTSPYDLFADLLEVESDLTADGGRADDYLPWGVSAAYDEGAPATEIDAVFSTAHTTSWELQDDGRYLPTSSFAADDDEFVADTVVALEVDVVDAGYLDPAGNPVPESLLEGSGTATVFHDGRAVEAEWSKDSPGDALELTTDDGPLLVPPGHTWIELLPSTTGSLDYR